MSMTRRRRASTATANPAAPQSAAQIDLDVEAARIGATFRLAYVSEEFPELLKRVTAARLDLAAAIIAMDEAEGVPGRHNLQEQVAVNAALSEFGNAFADLLRGDAGS